MFNRYGVDFFIICIILYLSAHYKHQNNIKTSNNRHICNNCLLVYSKLNNVLGNVTVYLHHQTKCDALEIGVNTMEKKTDRRIRKTKSQLRQGLAKLMEEKSINEITVKELVEEVDINRSTFYLHYTDIYDMLEKIEDELMEEIKYLFDATEEQIGKPQASLPFLVELFSMLDHNRDICRALSGPHGDLSFITRIEGYIAKHSAKYTNSLFNSSIESDMKYIHSYCITGCVGMVKLWLNENYGDSPEHMAKITYDMLIASLQSYLKESSKKNLHLLD